MPVTYICIYIYAYIYAYICVYAYIYINICIYMYIYAYPKPRGLEVQCNLILGMLLAVPLGHRMMPLSSMQIYTYPQYQAQLPVLPTMWGCLAALLESLAMSPDRPWRAP